MGLTPRVRFARKPSVIKGQYTTQVESKDLWYTKKELQRIHAGMRCAVKNLALSEPSFSPITDSDSSDNDENTSSNEFHWRGLEHIQQGTGTKAMESRQLLVKGVMSLQKMHNQLKLSSNDNSLGLFVRGYNQEAVQRARDIARKDYVEALQVYNHDRVEAYRQS